MGEEWDQGARLEYVKMEQSLEKPLGEKEEKKGKLKGVEAFFFWKKGKGSGNGKYNLIRGIV